MTSGRWPRPWAAIGRRCFSGRPRPPVAPLTESPIGWGDPSATLDETASRVAETARYARAMFELKITGGTIVDGTGRPAFVGDVAIDRGVIVAVGEHVEGDATEVIDAT